MKFSIRDLLFLMFAVVMLADSHRHELFDVEQNHKLAVYETTLDQLNENQRIFNSWSNNWDVRGFSDRIEALENKP